MLPGMVKSARSLNFCTPFPYQLGEKNVSGHRGSRRKTKETLFIIKQTKGCVSCGKTEALPLTGKYRTTLSHPSPAVDSALDELGIPRQVVHMLRDLSSQRLAHRCLW